jgi:carboxyl-terminal processing protease
MGPPGDSDAVRDRGSLRIRGCPVSRSRHRPSGRCARAGLLRRGTLTLLAVWLLTTAVAAAENPYRALKLFGEVLELVRKRYVEGISRDSLTLHGLKGLLDSLDSSTLYLEDLAYRRYVRPGPLSFPRLGLSLGARGGRLLIVAPLPGSAADTRGLLPGDMIFEVGTQTTAGMSPREVLAALGEDDGAEFLVGRGGLARPLRVKLAAGHYRLEPLWTVLHDSVGYIRPGWIVEGTGVSTLEALKELQRNAVRSLILDLRTSPGEELEEAARVAGAFLERDLTVGYVSESDDDSRTYYRTESDPLLPTWPVAVLVGPGTCCAGEMLAASLKVHNRAVLLGAETYGKGTLQKTLPLTSSTGIVVTYARWYTPDGWCIDRELGGWDPVLDQTTPQVLAGLSPHVAVPADTINTLEAALRFTGALSMNDYGGSAAELLTERGFLFLPTREAVDSVLAVPGGAGSPVFLAAEREAALERVAGERLGRDAAERTLARLLQDRAVSEALAVLSDPEKYQSLLAGGATVEREDEPSVDPRHTPVDSR